MKIVFKKETDGKLNTVNIDNLNDDLKSSIELNTKDFLIVDIELLPDIPPDIENIEYPNIYYKLDTSTDTIQIDRERIIQEWKERKKEQLISFIESFYPKHEKDYDLSKKIYYETYLKGKYQNIPLEKIIMDLVLKYYDNPVDIKEFLRTNLDSTVYDETADFYAYRKLVEVGLKILWISKCEQILSAALNNITEPIYPEMPTLIE